MGPVRVCLLLEVFFDVFLMETHQNSMFIIYKLMKYRKLLLKYNAYFQKVIFSQVKYKILYILLPSLYIPQPRDRTASQTLHNKISIFGVNMTFISANEVKNVYFMSGKATNEIDIFHFMRFEYPLCIYGR